VRVVLLVLLFVNLAYFAWSHWLAPKDPALPVSPAVSAPPLQLSNESAPVALDGSCVTVGPFANAALAARARQTLIDAGYASVPREEEERLLDGYWVYLEAPVNPTAERRLLERLSRGGIPDAQVVGEPGSRRISLGVFTDEQRAFAQSERVARLQLLPQIEAREKKASTIWLDLTLKSGSPPLEGQKFQAGDSELEFRPCPRESEAPAAQNPAAE
jgi:hypothetical protein